MAIQKKILKILHLLEKTYGMPRRFKKSEPVDELVRTVLSQNTSDKNSLKAFDILKKRFKTWDGILKINTSKLAGLIKHAGLANIKAKRIKDILVEIKRREGKIGLSSLDGMDLENALDYLSSLKGVGPKTSACVLLFSFHKPVMPVDTHIFRVTKRLGLIKESLNIEEAHQVLTALVPKGLIYDFHLCIIEHGRRTCRANNPHCSICAVYALCQYKSKTFYRKRETCQ